MFVSFGFLLFTGISIVTAAGYLTARELTCLYIAAGVFEFFGILITVDAIIDTKQGAAFTPGPWAKWRGPALIVGGIALGVLGNIESLHTQQPHTGMQQTVAMPAPPGIQTDAGLIGLIVNSLVALGAFMAGGAAVWVATTDRQLRRKERDAENDAQANLVFVTAELRNNPREIQVKVMNHGIRAIADETFVRLSVEGHDLGDLQPTTGPFPIIATPGNSSLFTFNPENLGSTHPYYVAIKGGPNEEPAPTITRNTKITATVRWTDIMGKVWERQGAGPWVTAEPGFAIGSEVGKPVRILT